MLTAREAQLTFDGREERQRHLSFFRRVHAKRDARVFIDHEVVLCAEKSRASLSSTRARTAQQRAHRSARRVPQSGRPAVMLSPQAVP